MRRIVNLKSEENLDIDESSSFKDHRNQLRTTLITPVCDEKVI